MLDEQQGPAASGIDAARRAVLAIADGDEAGALAALNATSHAEAVWAASYLLSAVRECAQARFGPSPRRVSDALRRAVADTADPVLTQVALIVEDAARDL